MSETTKLKLFKHDNVETNTNKFDIDKALNENWDKIDNFVTNIDGQVSEVDAKNIEQDTKITEITEKNTEQDNEVSQLQTEKAELESELKELQEDFYCNSLRGQASGEYIHVENSSNCRCKIGIGGNQEQETTSTENGDEYDSPSPDYPSEVKTVKDTVKVSVCNENLLNFNVAQNDKVSINTDGTITINGDGGFNLKLEKVKIKANIQYYIRWELVSGSIDSSKSGGNVFLNPTLSMWIEQNSFTKIIKTEDTNIEGIWINGSVVFTNAKIKMWISRSQIDYILHQSQNYIVPIQQEMLTDDCIDFENEEEVHTWGKYVLTGDEYWKIGTVKEKTQVFLFEAVARTNTLNYICNCFASGTGGKDVEGMAFVRKDMYLAINKSRLEGFSDDLTDTEKVALFKAYLKELYDAGTPVIVYYKLQTETRLKFTDEQKEAVKELKKARTYKNITNITTDGIAVLDLDYAKDLEIEQNKMQNEIDEIKQLLSTTQTSALLLDNIQKDLESEVE